MGVWRQFGRTHGGVIGYDDSYDDKIEWATQQTSKETSIGTCEGRAIWKCGRAVPAKNNKSKVK